jgi:hypothetical protein
MMDLLQRGASLERQAILAKLRRARKAIPASSNTLCAFNLIDELIRFVKGREVRTNKKKGGV